MYRLVHLSNGAIFCGEILQLSQKKSENENFVLLKENFHHFFK
jgi:hypothetical protein